MVDVLMWFSPRFVPLQITTNLAQHQWTSLRPVSSCPDVRGVGNVVPGENHHRAGVWPVYSGLSQTMRARIEMSSRRMSFSPL